MLSLTVVVWLHDSLGNNNAWNNYGFHFLKLLVCRLRCVDVQRSYPSKPNSVTYPLKILTDLNAVLCYVHIRRASPSVKCVYSQMLWYKIWGFVRGWVTRRSQGIPDILMRFIWRIYQQKETIAGLSVRVDAQRWGVAGYPAPCVNAAALYLQISTWRRSWGKPSWTGTRSWSRPCSRCTPPTTSSCWR